MSTHTVDEPGLLAQRHRAHSGRTRATSVGTRRSVGGQPWRWTAFRRAVAVRCRRAVGLLAASDAGRCDRACAGAASMNSRTALAADLQHARGADADALRDAEWYTAFVVDVARVRRTAVTLLAFLHDAVATVRCPTSLETRRLGRMRNDRLHRPSRTDGEHPVVRKFQTLRHTSRHDVVSKLRVAAGKTVGLVRIVVVVVGAERMSNLVSDGQCRDAVGDSFASCQLTDQQRVEVVDASLQSR